MRLEKQILMKENNNIKIETLKEREDKLHQENQDYRSQISLLSDQILVQDSKTLGLENSLTDLKSSMNEKEEVFRYFVLVLFCCLL